MFGSSIAVIVGGGFGCLLRWIIGSKLNGLFPNLPLGTLLVNLVGGFVIGVAMAYFVRHPNLDATWRLLTITGFCGGFTTFSAFSAEVVFMLQQGKFGWAAVTVTTHVVGSLVMTILGYAVVTNFD